jgi:hypothetical protein
MALFDELPNLFLTQKPEYLKGLLNADIAQTGVDKYKQLENQSNISGLLNTFVNYIAQPKNQGYGSIIPYAAKSYLAGTAGAQGVYDTKTKNVLDALNIAKTTKQIEMEGMTELDKLIYNRKRLQETDPNSPYLGAYDAAIGGRSGGYGTSVEGTSLNMLIRGSANTPDAIAFRKSPAYAIAWRDANEAKTIMQTRVDANGTEYQVPVKIKPAPLPPNILPPLNEDGSPMRRYSGQPSVTQPSVDGSQVSADNVNAPAGTVTKPATALQPAEIKEYRNKVTSANDFLNSLDSLEKHVKKYGIITGGLGGEGGVQASLAKMAQTKLRIASDMGVLNIQDKPEIAAMLADPTSMLTLLKGGGANFEGTLKGLRESTVTQRDFYKGLYEPNKKPLTDADLFKKYPVNTNRN